MSYLRFTLAAAVLLVCAGCGSSYSSMTSPTTPSTGGNGTPVSMVNGASLLTTTAFAPSPVTVAVGASVTWTNKDNTAHTSTGSTWNSGSMVASGATTGSARRKCLCRRAGVEVFPRLPLATEEGE